MNFLRSRAFKLSVGVVLLVAVASVTAWRITSRSSARDERTTQERIGREARESIDRSMSGVKLCPLSDPDCNRR